MMAIAQPISLQLYQASTALLVGLFAGVYYDALKTVRRRAGRKGVTVLADVAFWLGVGILLFAQTMTVGDGGFRIFMLVANFCGVVMYFLALSRYVFVLFWSTSGVIVRIIQLIKSFTHKIWLKGGKVATVVKKAFQKMIRHTIIIKSVSIFCEKRRETRRKTGGATNQKQTTKQTGQYHYKSSGAGAGFIHSGDVPTGKRSNRRRPRRPRSA